MVNATPAPVNARTVGKAKDVKSKRLAGKKVPQTTLWRGMRGVRATKEFREHGGTELAPMSTTADFKVAVK